VHIFIQVVTCDNARDNNTGELEAERRKAAGADDPSLTLLTLPNRRLRSSGQGGEHLTRRAHRLIDLALGVSQGDERGFEL
jgi:hypothetical protein